MMDNIGQKYDFLLHPIKDLMKNWNVDIATVLENYLGEIEKMTFSFDGGKTKLNFAEASFLIQGTACVWSRKVEHLHSLVYQTLEMISSNRQDKQPSSIDPQGVDKDATFDDHEDQFMRLNDIRPSSLKKMVTGGANVISIARYSTHLQGTEENRGSLFLNENGEITNHYRDFWANNTTPTRRGIVMLEQILNEDTITTFPMEMTVENHDKEAPPAEPLPLIDAPADDFMDDMGGCHDDNDGGGDASEIFVEVEEVRQLRQRAAATTGQLQTLIEESPSLLNRSLDPHSKCKDWTPKPFVKGKTMKLPASLEGNKRKRKKAQPKPSMPLLSDFLRSAKKKTKKGVDFDPIKEEQKRRAALWKELKAAHSKYQPNDEVLPGIEDDEVFADDVIDDVNEQFDDDDDGAPDLCDLINDVEENKATIAETSFSPDHQSIETYEDLVRHHVDIFYSSAKRYMQESALGQRVKEWQQSVHPFLEEQDARPEFDIHKYGDDVVASFDKVGNEKQFSKCVVGEERWSICRHFAATLQLANDQNFLLSTNEDELADTVNELKLKLLTQDRLRERIEDYAPS